MIKNILSQDYYADVTSQNLISFIEKHVPKIDDATLYYQFPFVRESNGNVAVSNIMIISRIYGVVIFKCDSISKKRNDSEITKLDEELSSVENTIFAKLIKSTNRKLKRGKRDLSFNLSSALYLPKFSDDNSCFENQVIKTVPDIKAFFRNCKNEEISPDVMEEIFSVIDSAASIVKAKERFVDESDTTSKAYILRRLEAEIANFDDKQKYAALSQLDGPQRIRGLAGSGKTIILCMKAAILHLRNPKLQILYTYTTKSLHDYIEMLITRFYKAMSDGLIPDFDSAIHIQHSWGGKNLKGVYYEACSDNNIIPVDFKTARSRSSVDDAFDYICKDLLKQSNGRLNKKYDYILMDEAQDFKPSFYQVCRALVKNDCLVWCYDDLQNIFHVDIQDTEKTFKNEYGAEGINLGALQSAHPDMDNDIVLPKSYRNPKEILVMAHAIGFGIYNDKLIQMLQNNEHWEDLGYKVIKGNCNNDENMVIERDPECSPLNLSKYQSSDEIIELYSAEDFDSEISWICDKIVEAIRVDKLRPDDITVVCIDDRHNKSYFDKITNCLREKEIYTHNLSNNFYETGFTEDQCVTLSTVYKAKGNEAAMIFVVGCDVAELEKDNRTMRNKLFTAFTRAKAWLKISGVQFEDSSLVREIKTIKEKNFVLDFIYKDAPIIQRDLDSVNEKKATKRKLISELIDKAKSLGLNDDEIHEMIKNYDIESRSDQK